MSEGEGFGMLGPKQDWLANDVVAPMIFFAFTYQILWKIVSQKWPFFAADVLSRQSSSDG